MKTKMKREQGQSLVEMALLFPLLIMLMMGLLDIGRAYYVLVALNDAASEGASYASIFPSDVGGVQSRTAEASGGLVTIAPGDVVVKYPATLRSGAPITVTIEHAMVLYTPFVNGLVAGDGLTLQGQAAQPLITVR